MQLARGQGGVPPRQFYVRITYPFGGTSHSLGTYSTPSTSAVMVTVKGFDIPEGSVVDIEIYDDVSRTDYIGGARGSGGVVA